MKNHSTEEQYQIERSRRIAAMTSSDELIAGIVERAGYPPLVEKVRITEGFSNEVYRATTADGQELILRIHWYNSPHFEAETWALAQCAVIQLPTPRILYLEHHLSGEIPRSACIETALPGKPLAALLKMQVHHPDDCRPLLVELGALLTRLHTIPTQGYGPIDGNEIAAKGSSVETIYTQPDGQLLQAAENVGLEPADIVTACQLLAGCSPIWQNSPPRLLHGDLSLEHIMVDEGRLSGLIDFEFPHSGDPAMDIAYWGCWDPFKDFSLPVEWIMEGYAQHAPIDASFALRVLACRLQLSLQLLSYHSIQDAHSPRMVAYLRQRFHRDVEGLKNA